MTEDDIKNIEAAIDKRVAKIEQLDLEIVGSTAGAVQAIDLLKKSLDEIIACLHELDFSGASSLGYGDVTSNFIFLQRTLAGLQGVSNETDALIQEVAMETTGVSDDVAPYVLSRIKTPDG